MALVPIQTHVNDAVSRLISDVQTKPMVVALLSAMVKQVQQLENILLQLQVGLNANLLVGQQLDDFGTLIGVDRNGLDDDSYRALLEGTIGSNFSDGSQGVLLEALAQLFESSAIFRKDPNSTNSQSRGYSVLAFGIGSPKLPKNLYANAIQTFKNAIPAGIGLFYLSTFDASTTFAFDGPQAWVHPMADGRHPGSIGTWANVIFSDPVL